MEKKLLFAIMALSVNAFAQPTINYNANHSIGSTGVMYIIGGSISPLQQSGASLSWDLSSNSLTQAGSFAIVDPATTPHAAGYPSANTCFKQTVTGQGTTYTYIADSINGLYSIATGIGGSDPTIWTQHDRVLKYPFNYTDSFSSVRKSSTDSPEPFTRTYDAYGTLTVNGKTFTNVVRVVKNPGNAIWFTTSPVWFPIIIQMNETTYAYTEPTFVSGIHEPSSMRMNVSIYPNPAANSVSIKLPAALIGSDIIVYDGAGRQIKTEKIEGETSTIHIGDVPKGVYILEIGGQQKLTYKLIRQ